MLMFRRRARPAASAVFLTLALAWSPAPVLAADRPEEAAALVSGLATEVAALPADGAARQELRRIYRARFDGRALALGALGRYARLLPAERTADYLAAFEDHVLARFGARIDAHGHDLVVGGVREAGEDRLIVSSMLPRDPEPPLMIEWVLAPPADGDVPAPDAPLRIVDVVVDGDSLVDDRRQAFLPEVRRGGVAALLADLRRPGRHADLAPLAAPPRSVPQPQPKPTLPN
ncbi:ABC transporter substrate-binding protein [Zavarzinia sp. CC-PAN008]|uniref:ABC transporter substrate-binding protein n=1 Tax=Zavarzinia sp. CC-PAN008 TaxID=3243332 RepID=UPI003F744C1E